MDKINNVSTQIIEVLDALCAKFGVAVDWTAANILPYAQDLCDRIVRYAVIKSVILIVIAVAATILAWSIAVKMNKYDNEGVMLALSIAVTISGVVAVVIGIVTIIRASFLPEMIIANYLRPYIY